MLPPPCGEHVARGGARAQEDAGEVDVDDLLPVRERQLGRRPADGDPGARHEHVNLPVALSHLPHRCVDRGLVGDVEPDRGGTGGTSRSSTTTVAPAAANSSAQAAPMPLAPPVTTATRPRRSVRREGSGMRVHDGAGRRRELSSGADPGAAG